MAVGNRRTSIASSLSNNTAPLVAVGIGICVAVAVGILLTGADPTVGLFLLPALGLVALALRSPYWLVVIGLAQLSFIPIEDNLFGYYIPNVLQFLAPLAVGAALFQALRTRDHDVLRLRLPDMLIAAFALWGIVGRILNGNLHLAWYGNAVVFVMFWYYAIRLLPLNREKVTTLLMILAGGTAVQAALMVHESLAGGSPLYGTPSAEEFMQGVPTAIGPFGYFWDAGAYLALWPPVLIYMIARSRSMRKQVIWSVALVAIIAAATRTMERASVAAILLGILVCLLAPKLRRVAGVILAVLAIACVPWSMSSFGAPLMTRFGQVDQSRYARRSVALNLMKSGKWNPVWGVGWNNFSFFGRGMGTKEEITVFGKRRTTVERAGGGSELHNVWLAIPVEFGLVGLLIALGLAAGLAQSSVRLWVRFKRHGDVDDGLVVALVASPIALAAVGYYHNIYSFEACMCIFWVFYALLVSHGEAMRE